MNYRIATMNDIDLLVSQRIIFCKIDEKDSKYATIKDNLYLYFKKTLNDNTCVAVLAEDDDKNCIGTGVIFYYNSVPSSFNVTGKNAYITSVYVDEKYRRKGVATAILEQLISISVSRGYEKIFLSATEMGKPLYAKMGFTELTKGMILDIQSVKNLF